MHLRRRGFDGAAIPAARSRRVQRPVHVHGAGLHVAKKLDRAVVILDGLRLDDARVVHHGSEQAAGRLRGQQHVSAIRADQAAVADEGIDRPFVHRDIEQPISRHVEGQGIAGGERHRTKSCGDHPFIADIGAQ